MSHAKGHEHKLAYKREWYRLHPRTEEQKKRASESTARWRKSHPETAKSVARRAFLRSTYGLEPSEFDRMLADQGGVCAICGTSDWGVKGPLVDHDHETGSVRGLLCIRCNSALGFVKDDVTTLARMIQYLRG